MIVLSAMMCCGQEKENNKQTNKIQKRRNFQEEVILTEAEGWRQEVKIQSWKKGLPTSTWWKQHLGKAIRNQGQDKEGTSNAKAYLSTM